MRARQSGWLVVVGVGCLLAAAGAQAQTNTDRPGSILMFPKVVRDGLRDTIIQITNTGNSLNTLHCLYLNGAPGRTGAPVCTATNFDIALTRQQPTQWRVSSGRPVNPSDPPGSPNNGYDPGLIPTVPVGFTGALVCIEVQPDGSLAPFAQNRVKGEATLIRDANGDVSKYNAIAVPAGAPNLDNLLSLNDAEYERCPNNLRMNFLADGGLDPVIEAHGNGGGVSSVVSNLTLLPCDLDFQNGTHRTSGNVSFLAWDEFETQFSGSFPFGCWASFNLGEVSQFRSLLQSGGTIPTLYANAELTPNVPLVGVLESFHTDSLGVTAGAAVNLHETVAEVTNNANIVLP